MNFIIILRAVKKALSRGRGRGLGEEEIK